MELNSKSVQNLNHSKFECIMEHKYNFILFGGGCVNDDGTIGVKLINSIIVYWSDEAQSST